MVQMGMLLVFLPAALGLDLQYEFFSTAKTFADAETACVAWGGNSSGHLAVVTTAEQNACLRAAIGGDGECMIGLTDAVTEDTWTWTDNTTLGVGNKDGWASGAGYVGSFNSGEPNNGAGTGAEHCVVSKGNSGGWNDIVCGSKPYACSKVRQQSTNCPTGQGDRCGLCVACQPGKWGDKWTESNHQPGTVSVNNKCESCDSQIRLSNMKMTSISDAVNDPLFGISSTPFGWGDAGTSFGFNGITMPLGVSKSKPPHNDAAADCSCPLQPSCPPWATATSKSQCDRAKESVLSTWFSRVIDPVASKATGKLVCARCPLVDCATCEPGYFVPISDADKPDEFYYPFPIDDPRPTEARKRRDTSTCMRCPAGTHQPLRTMVTGMCSTTAQGQAPAEGSKTGENYVGPFGFETDEATAATAITTSGVRGADTGQNDGGDDTGEVDGNGDPMLCPKKCGHCQAGDKQQHGKDAKPLGNNGYCQHYCSEVGNFCDEVGAEGNFLDCSGCAKIDNNKVPSQCPFVVVPRFKTLPSFTPPNPCPKCPFGSVSHQGASNCTVCPSGTIVQLSLNTSLATKCFVCERAEACPGGGVCALGYSVESLCILCTKFNGTQTGYYKLNGRCKACPADGSQTTMVVGGVLFVCIVVFLLAGGTPGVFESVTIAIMYFQELAISIRIPLRWPASIINLSVEISQYLSMDVSVASPDCSVIMSFTEKWWYMMLSPLVVVAIYTIMYFLMSLCVKDKLSLFHKTVASLLTWVRLLYMSLLMMILSNFKCNEETGALYSNPAFKCSGAEYDNLWFGSVFFFIVYIMGYPVVTYMVLRSGRNAGVFLSKSFVKRFGSLFAVYDEDHWYWTLFEVNFRRVSLAAYSIFFRDDMWMAGMCMSAHIAYFWRMKKNMPFRNFAALYEDSNTSAFTNLDFLTLQLTVIQVFVLAAGLYINYQVVDDEQTEKDSSSTSGTVALVIQILVGYGTFINAYYTCKIAMNDKALKGQGFDMYLPDGWKWWPFKEKDLYKHEASNRFGLHRPYSDVNEEASNYWRPGSDADGSNVAQFTVDEEYKASEGFLVKEDDFELIAKDLTNPGYCCDDNSIRDRFNKIVINRSSESDLEDYKQRKAEERCIACYVRNTENTSAGEVELQELGMSTQKQIEAIWQSADVDGDGFLSRSEFEEYEKKTPVEGDDGESEYDGICEQFESLDPEQGMSFEQFHMIMTKYGDPAGDYNAIFSGESALGNLEEGRPAHGKLKPMMSKLDAELLANKEGLAWGAEKEGWGERRKLAAVQGVVGGKDALGTPYGPQRVKLAAGAVNTGGVLEGGKEGYIVLDMAIHGHIGFDTEDPFVVSMADEFKPDDPTSTYYTNDLVLAPGDDGSVDQGALLVFLKDEARRQGWQALSDEQKAKKQTEGRAALEREAASLAKEVKYGI